MSIETIRRERGGESLDRAAEEIVYRERVSIERERESFCKESERVTR